MIADTAYIVFGIGDKHFRIIRVWSVRRISQPEVLPNHNTVSVASFVKLFVTNHSYPVAHDVEVHVSMVSDGCIVLAATVVQIRFAESPVTAPADEATSVDVHVQDMIVFVVCHLPDARLKVYTVRNLIANLEDKACIVQIRLAIAFRPPQTRMLYGQFFIICRCEGDFLFFASLQGNLLCDTDITDSSFQYSFHIFLGMIFHESTGGKCCRRRIR